MMSEPDCTLCSTPYVEPTTGEVHDVVYCTDYTDECPCTECHNEEVDA